MAARFPIVSLTPETFEKIAMLLDPPDLFELAQGSEQSHDLVKNTMKKLEKTLIVDFSLFRGISSVRIFLNARMLFDWKFCNKRNSMRFELEDLEPRIFNGISESEAPIVFYRKSQVQYESVYTCTEDILKIAQYLADLFDLPVKNLYFESHHLDYLDSILSCNMIKKDQLQFVNIAEAVVSHSELLQILEGFGDRALHIYEINTQRGFVYDEMITRRNLKVNFSTWFTGAMLMNLDCEYADLAIYNVENEDVNNLLLHIMNSSSHKLKTLAIFKERHLPNVDVEPDHDDDWEERMFNMDKISQGLDEFHEEHAGFDAETQRRFKTINGTFVNVEIDNNEHQSEIYLWTGLSDSFSEASYE